MKKLTQLIMVSLILTSSIIFGNNIIVHADTNLDNLDFNSDGIIDIQDLANVATNYNLKNGCENWNLKYDLNGDNIIDIFDLVKISKAIGTETLSDKTDITSKFTDVNFKTIVYTLIRKTSPAPILYSDVKKVLTVSVNSKSMTSLHGIEYFTALTYLNCMDNKLKTLDVTKNTALTYLNCSYNQLTTLYVNKNVALTDFDCSYNQLITLYICKNIALTNLQCSYNQLTTLNSIKDTWNTGDYKTQYIDASHTDTTDNLVIRNLNQPTGNELVACAYNYIGTPYVYGGSSPSGFDDSGFMQYVYAHFGIGISRITYIQATSGYEVPRDELKPGDLVFFGSSISTLHHVGMYVGNGCYIHATHTGDVISVSNFTGRTDFCTARRICN